MKAKTNIGLCNQCNKYTIVANMINYSICGVCYINYCEFSYELGEYLKSLDIYRK